MKKDLKKLRLLIIDVDGTMTDAGIYYDNAGNELKKFCTKDGAGFFAAKQVGMTIMVLTGRECEAVTKRMKEMKVDYLKQNITDKAIYLNKFIQERQLKSEEIAYIGDDLNDLPGMRLCSFVGCPADACKEVKIIADYVSTKEGGRGAVRDIIEYILMQRCEWASAVEEIYGTGI